MAVDSGSNIIYLDGYATSALPGNPAIVWNGISSPNTIPSGAILASANGNYFLSVRTEELPLSVIWGVKEGGGAGRQGNWLDPKR